MPVFSFRCLISFTLSWASFVHSLSLVLETKEDNQLWHSEQLQQGLFIWKGERAIFSWASSGVWFSRWNAGTLRYNSSPFFMRKRVSYGMLLEFDSLGFKKKKKQHTILQWFALSVGFGTDPSSSLEVALVNNLLTNSSLRDVSTVTVSAISELRLHANAWGSPDKV